MIYRANKGGYTSKIAAGDETPDDLEHLSEADFNSAIDDERYWKALHAEGVFSIYAMPYGSGGYVVSVDAAGGIRTAIYDPSWDDIKAQFEQALLAEETTTTVTVGLG